MPEQDVYRMCVCGSGKKLKFCCLSVIDELGRAAELEQREQYDKSAAYLEGVLKKGVSERTARTGVRLALAVNVMRVSNVAPPGATNERLRGLVHEMLKDTPDHPEVLALDAMQELRDKGYPAAQKKFSRMLQKIDGGESPWGSTALFALAEHLLVHSHALAGIKHFLLAGLLSSDDSRESLFEEVSRLIRSGGLLYPLRLRYVLRPIADLGPLQAQFDVAKKLVEVGCFSDAAKAFAPIARERGDDWGVWWNMGLCHAWAAEDPLAVRALTAAAAAANPHDPETAAECLMLARVLDQPGDDVAVEAMTQNYTVDSMSRLMAALDASPRFERVDEQHDHDHDGADSHLPHDPSSVTYVVFDKPQAKSTTGAPTGTPGDWPKVEATVRIESGNPRANEPAKAMLIAMGRDVAISIANLLQELAGSDVRPAGELEVDAKLYPEQVVCDDNVIAVKETPNDALIAERAILADKVERWFNTPQSLLKGNSPLQAAQISELQTALRASVLLLEAYMHRRDQMIDVDSIRGRLGLPPLDQIEIESDDALHSLGALSYRRVNLASAPEDVVVKLMLDSQTTESPVLISLQREVLRRREALSDTRVLEFTELALVDSLRRVRRPEESLEVIRGALERGRKNKKSLQILVSWEIRLLTQTRILEKLDEAREIAQRVWTQYVPKLPEIRAELVNALRNLVADGPWHAPDAPIPTAGITSAGGIWTPESAPAEAPGKLWIPGA